MKPLFVTGNQDKADYLAKMLGIVLDHKKIELDELQSINLETIVEHKVRQAYEITGQSVLVEDVGLGFEALGGYRAHSLDILAMQMMDWRNSVVCSMDLTTDAHRLPVYLVILMANTWSCFVGV